MRMRDLPEAWALSAAIQMLLVSVILILYYAFGDKGLLGNRNLSF
jgi:hypothetical protein